MSAGRRRCEPSAVVTTRHVFAEFWIPGWIPGRLPKHRRADALFDRARNFRMAAGSLPEAQRNEALPSVAA